MNKQITKQILIIGYDGRGLGWVVLFKIPWSIYPMLFRVTNLSALLLPYFTVMLFFFFFFCFSMAVGTNWCFWFFLFFFFPISVLVFLGMMSIPLLPHSSWLFPISQHCFSFNINISWFLLLWQVNIYYAIFTKHCCMYMTPISTNSISCSYNKALLYVHDIELVEIGVWWTMSVCFFFHPTRPKHREIKMEKQKKKSLAMTLIIAMIVTAMTTVNI